VAELPAPTEGIVLTHFLVSDDVERSRRFYTEVLGGETVREGSASTTSGPGGGPSPCAAPIRGLLGAVYAASWLILRICLSNTVEGA
jgi:hypothetical protein